MAELKALQKKIAALLYEQLSQYFNQVRILSYKPSKNGNVSGKFIGDRRNYTFILSNNQVQYLPSTDKMDSTLIAPKGIVQCSGSNHPCKGEKGTRCVPQNQSCKQREASDEGIARLKEISDASREITGLVSTGKPAPNKTSTEAPELDKDISLYDFMKYYSPWRAKGSEGFDKAKLRDVKRGEPKRKTKTSQQSKAEPKFYESKQNAKFVDDEPEAKRERQSEPEAKPKGLGGAKQSEEKTKAKQEPKTKSTNPYDFLGISPQDFPDEAALYKAAKVAYRNLAVKYHPDKGGDPQMMVELNNVMDRLKSIENKRKAKERGDSRCGFGKRRR